MKINLNIFKSKIRLPKLSFVFIVMSFALWMFIFRDFFKGELYLQGDARPYFEHFKYFIDNITRGVYPLWESPRQKGIPIEFFMQRIGSFNPIFFLIPFFDILGFSYKHSYLFFLSFYFFIGLMGFYLVAKILFKDEIIAFVAYLLITFSSLGTTLFYSYLYLVSVPLAWFFFFFLSFCEKQNKLNFLGMTFSVMILLGTYLPFYFLVIFAFFCMSFYAFFFKEFHRVIIKTYSFFKKYKIFVMICLSAIFCSLIPGIQLYHEMGKGEIVMPGRHSGSEQVNELYLNEKKIEDGGMQPIVVARNVFSNLHLFQLGDFFIPVFLFIPFLLGSITSINRRLLSFLVWGGLIYFVSIANTTPLAPFLYKHIFLFKLFRNYEFFLWFILLPIFVLLSTVLLQSFLKICPQKKSHKPLFYGFLLVVHLGFMWFLICQENTPLTSYITVIFSFIIVALYLSGKFTNKTPALYILLFVTIVLQPIEVFSRLTQNTFQSQSYAQRNPDRYRGKSPFLEINLPRKFHIEKDVYENKKYSREDLLSDPQGAEFTIGIRYYDDLQKNISKISLMRYQKFKLILYDNVEFVKDLDYEKLSYQFMTYKNNAFISIPKIKDKEQKNAFLKSLREQSLIQGFENNIHEMDKSKPGNFFTPVLENDSAVKLLTVDTNFLKLKTNFSDNKFLVFNDSYCSGWHVFVDGKESILWRANAAFKGVFVPKGEHAVLFRFGTPLKYCLKFFLLGINFLVFIALLFLLYLKIFRKIEL